MIEKREAFETIEVGQWIWTMDSPRYSSTERDPVIHEVTRLTKTQIICDDQDDFDRFRKNNGWNNHSYSRRHIVGIASQEEITNQGIPRKREREAEKVRRAKCDEIKAILPEGMKAYLNFDGVWEMSFEAKGITEEQVRLIAASLEDNIKEQKNGLRSNLG